MFCGCMCKKAINSPCPPGKATKLGATSKVVPSIVFITGCCHHELLYAVDASTTYNNSHDSIKRIVTVVVIDVHSEVDIMRTIMQSHN